MEGKYSFLDIGDLPEDDDLPAGDPESSEDNFRSDEFWSSGFDGPFM